MIGLAIRRPVAVRATALALALGGVAAANHVSVELLPDIELPRLHVTALVPARSPAATEALVTARIESVVQEVHGVARVTSTSEEHAGAGYARVDVSFARGTDMQLARLDLSDALARLDRELPPEVGGPYVSAYVPRAIGAARMPLLTFVVTGTHTPHALRRHAERVLVPALRRVPGVGDVVVEGRDRRVLRLELDGARSAALGVDATDVHRAVGMLTLGGHAGSIRDDATVRPITLEMSPLLLNDVGRAILPAAGRREVRVGDVARAVDGFDEADELLRVDGLPAVMVRVRKAQAINALRVSDAVKARVATLHDAREDTEMHVRVLLAGDESAAIRAYRGRARRSAIAAVIGVVCVLLVVIRSASAAAIPLAVGVIAVHAALLGAYVARASLNLLTAGGVAVALVPVVLSAVVVVESVWRRLGAGDRPAVAAERGAREVVRPVVGVTWVVLAVIVPLGALDGALRAYVAPLATVVAATIVTGLLLSFTLAPSLAARVPRGRLRPVRTGRRCWLRRYVRVLAWTVSCPRTTVWLTLAAISGGAALAVVRFVRGDARAPRAAALGASTIGVRVELPRGASLSRTDDLARRFERIVREHARAAGVSRYVTRVTPARVEIDVDFAPAVGPSRGPASMERRLSPLARSLGGVGARVVGPDGAFAGAAPSPPTYALVVRGYGYETVRRLAEGIGERLRRYPRVTDVDVDAAGYGHARTSEVRVLLDRTRLARHGLTVHDAIVAVTAAARAPQAGAAQVPVGGERLPIVVGRHDGHGVARHALGAIPMRGSARGGARPFIRLADVARFEAADAPARIERVDQQYQRLVTWEFRGTSRVGDAVADDVERATALPPGYTLRRADDGAAARPDAGRIAFAAAASLTLVFMLSALLLESLRQPVCVLLALPVASTGALVALALGRALPSSATMLAIVVASGLAMPAIVLFADRVSRLGVADRASGHACSARRAAVRGAVESVRPVFLSAGVALVAVVVVVAAVDPAVPRVPSAFGLAIGGAVAAVALFTFAAAPALSVLVACRRPERFDFPSAESKLLSASVLAAASPSGDSARTRRCPTSCESE